MVTRTTLGGEQFGWGAVSGGLSTFSPHPLLWLHSERFSWFVIRSKLNPNRLWQGHAYEWTVAQVEDDSNRHPIAFQSRSNRPNSTTPPRIVASNCLLFPQILCSDFIPNEKPHLAWPAATIPTTCNPGHAPPSSHLQASAAICNLHPAGSFASQQVPKRTSPQRPPQATLFLPSNLLAPSHTSPRISNPYDLFYPSIPSVFPLFFYGFTRFLHHFTLHSSLPKCTSEDGPGGNRTPPSPNCHLAHQPQNRPRRPPQLGGEVPQNCPCFQPPPPRPPILTSFAMSNFAMLDSWLS